jgi:hypothetical protein
LHRGYNTAQNFLEHLSGPGSGLADPAATQQELRAHHARWRLPLKARVEDFGFDAFLTVLFFIVLASVAMAGSVQHDTWWQLRTGQYIVATLRPPVTDPFSWTVRGGYWPNHEWLAEVLFYLVYRAGGIRVVAAFCGLAIIGTWMLIYTLTGGAGKVRVYSLLAGIATQSMIWSVRPALFSLLFLATALALLPHPRRRWLYPFLFLLWANTHAGMAFGIVVLGAATIVSLWADRRSLLRWMLVVGLSLGATLINPLGLGLWRLVVHSMSNPVLAVTEEWVSPRISTPLSYPFFALLAATTTVVWLRRRRWTSHFEWTLIVSGLIFAALGLKSLRHAANFALVAPVLISRYFVDVQAMPAFSSRKRIAHLLALPGLALLGLIFVRERWIRSTGRAALEPAISSALRKCPEQMFNTYEVGGNIIWAVPERPVFVDNRQDPYPPELILRTKYVEATGDYHALFDQYHIRCAIMPAHGPLPRTLAGDGWHVAAQDHDYVVMETGAILSAPSHAPQ